MNDSLFKVVSSLTELRALNVTLDGFPRFLLIGPESSGKTSLLEALAGVPVGFSASATATRCPVEYHFEHCKSADQQLHTVTKPNGEQSRHTSLLEVRKQIAEYMISLQKQSVVETKASGEFEDSPESFSPDVLTVHIRHPYCKNLVLMDTPGLKIGCPSRAVEDRVKEIVSRWARDPSYSLIMCCEWEQGGQLSSTRSIEEVLFDTPKSMPLRKVPGSIIVFNKFDKISDFDAEAIPDQLRMTVESAKNFASKAFFTTLRPRNGEYTLKEREAKASGRNLDTEEEIRLIHQIPTQEAKWKSQLAEKTTTEASSEFASKLLQYFGVTKLREYVQNLWAIAVRTKISGFLEDLERMEAEEKEEVKTKGDQIRELEGSQEMVGAKVQRIVDHYCDAFQGLISINPIVRKLEPRAQQQSFSSPILEEEKMEDEDFFNLGDVSTFNMLAKGFLMDVSSQEQDWRKWNRFRMFAEKKRRVEQRLAEGVPETVAEEVDEELDSLEEHAITARGPRKSFVTRMKKTLRNTRQSLRNLGPQRIPSVDISHLYLLRNHDPISSPRGAIMQSMDDASDASAPQSLEAIWKSYFPGSDEWKEFKDRECFGRESYERLVTAFSMVMFTLVDTSSISNNTINRCRNVLGQPDNVMALKQAHAELLSKMQAGEKGEDAFVQSLEGLFTRLHDPVFSYLKGTTVMDSTLDEISPQLHDEILTAVRTFIFDQADTVFKCYDTVINSVIQGWEPRMISPFLIGMYQSDFKEFFQQAQSPLKMEEPATDVKQKRQTLQEFHSRLCTVPANHPEAGNKFPGFHSLDRATGSLCWLPADIHIDTVKHMARTSAQLSATNLVHTLKNLLEVELYDKLAKGTYLRKAIWEHFTEKKTASGSSKLLVLTEELKNSSMLPRLKEEMRAHSQKQKALLSTIRLIQQTLVDFVQQPSSMPSAEPSSLASPMASFSGAMSEVDEDELPHTQRGPDGELYTFTKPTGAPRSAQSMKKHSRAFSEDDSVSFMSEHKDQEELLEAIH